MIGLYVHIPFCVKKCHYCDFYSITDAALIDSYVDAVLIEAQRYRDMKFDTLYIGGGTPSLLGTRQLTGLLSGLYRILNLAGMIESTIEVNPESASAEFFRAAKSKGINRVSIGVQSMVDSELAGAGRIHDARAATAVIMEARRNGFASISVDLIVGLPGQDVSTLLFSLQMLLNLDIRHVSLYCLSLEQGTPFAASPPRNLPSEKQQVRMFNGAKELLTRAGLGHYEISNFAVPGYECKHNLNYWRGGEYVGLGPAAASHVKGKRYRNKADVMGYIDNPKGLNEEVEELPPDKKAAEEAMLRLRLLDEGLNVDDLTAKFGETNTKALIGRLVRLTAAAQLHRCGAIYWLPPDRVLTSNPILAEVVGE